MRNDFESWLKRNVPAGQAWASRALTLATAGTATAAVWLSIGLMAGFDLPAGALPVEAGMAAAVQAAAPAASEPTVRHSVLPTVTIVGRRERAVPRPMLRSPAEVGAVTVPVEATVGMSAGGDNLRQ